MAVMADRKVDPDMDKDKWQNLFGNQNPSS